MIIYEVVETCDCYFHCDCKDSFYGKFLNKENAEKRMEKVKEKRKQFNHIIFINEEETRD